MILFSKPIRTFNFNQTVRLALVAAAMLLTACGSMRYNVSNRISLPSNAVIAVGPMANNSSTPLANRQVESMVATIMQTKGFKHIIPYPRKKSCEKLLYCTDEGLTHAQLIHWGRAHHVKYVMTGAANEWGYKVGLDGEPVAGVSLSLINVTTGQIVWTAVGSAIGSSRSGLDVIGQQLINNLLNAPITVC
jgi:hypothetical protein